jgi:four helix bundle protein
MFEQLPIFEKTYKLILWLYPTINKFPKSQRFVLGQQIENTALSILSGIIFANGERDKLPALKRVSALLDTLRILIRLAKDLEFISVRQYAFSAERVNEVGKMLGGWIKQSASSASPPIRGQGRV